MKRTWNLFWNALLISCKHSGRQLLCLLCVLLFCVGLMAAFFSVPRETPVYRAKVGVINLDENPLSISMINTLLEGENLSELVEVAFLPPDGAGREDCTAVITVPAGFLESVLTGENLSPVLELNLRSPLEALWVRQMAVAGARALSVAQQGIYAVLEAVDYGEGMDARQYNLLLADVNLTLLEAFFNRLSLMEERELSASGTLTLPQYYGAALTAALLFCYGFLFFPATENLRRFASTAGRCKGILFLAGTLHILLLEALLITPLYLLSLKFGTPWPAAWVLLALLTGSAALLCTQLFPSRAACAAGTMLLTLGQALCGGLLVPLPLLPAGFTALARFLPVCQGMGLIGASMEGPVEPGVPLAMSACFILLAGLIWMRRRRRG